MTFMLAQGEAGHMAAGRQLSFGYLRESPARWAAALALACLIACLAIWSTPARAAFDAPVAIDVSAVGDDEASRLIIRFDRQVAVTHQFLDHPFRLVLDFERIGYGFEIDDDTLGGLFAKMRYGDMSRTSSRMIFDIKAPFLVERLQTGPNDGLYQVVIDLKRTEASRFRETMIDTMQTSSIVRQADKADRLGAEPVSRAIGDTFTVVLDPGHGGIDSGAIGVGGTREKDVVLEFAHQMRQKLEEIEGIDVVMTRQSDVFVPLNERVRIARQHNGSLFVSLHADSVRQSYVRGATVYTISDKASDDVAAEIARSENLSDSIAGISYESDQDNPVTDILVDLARQETLGFSVQFARLLVSHISKSSRMIRNPHRYAGFRVLKAPDVPSVLIELGYLSNAEDEKLLNQPEWRAELAAELTAAVTEYATLSGRRLVAEKGD